MTATPGTEPWVFVRTDLNTAVSTYANGLWVCIGRDLTSNGNNNSISTATDPLGPWTRKQNFSFAWNNLRVQYSQGRWAFVAPNGVIYYSTDNWNTYSSHTPTFQGVVNTSAISLPVYDGNGTWALARQSPNQGNFVYEIQYGPSFFGPWTKIAGSSINLVPMTLDHNGEVWVAAGWSAYQSGLDPVPAVYATATNITGPWTQPEPNVRTTSSFQLYSPLVLSWQPSIRQWYSYSSGGGSRYARANADGWNIVGVTPAGPGVGIYAAGDGWIVTFARGSSGNLPLYLYYAKSESLGESLAMSRITDASWNTTGGVLDSSAFSDVAYGDGRFVLSGKPSTQAYYGVSVSPVGDDAFWGISLDDWTG